MHRKSLNNFSRLMFAATLLLTQMSFGHAQRRQAPLTQTTHQDASRIGRLRPPDSITCPDNNLTSFTGRILAYHRTPGRVLIRMRTDEETTESFTLRFQKTEDLAKQFLLHGELFKQSDWILIERGRGRIRPKMRATVWACDDGSKTIDWRPREINPTSVY